MKQNAASVLVLTLIALILGTGQPSRAAETLCGGFSEASVTNAEVIAAAQFAVKGAQWESIITLVSILEAQQQVVAGMNYRLRLKVQVDGKDREAEAVVWWQAWRRPDPYQLTSWTWKEEQR